MARIDKSVIVSHPAQRMFELVDAVEAYPEFLPWCGRTEVVHRDAETTLATIGIDYRFVRQSFTTRNRKEEGKRIDIALEKGPFRRLQGHWEFISLSAEACKIQFAMEYEFASRLLEKLAGPVFGYIVGSLVDAFVRRADSVYGAKRDADG